MIKLRYWYITVVSFLTADNFIYYCIFSSIDKPTKEWIIERKKVLLSGGNDINLKTEFSYPTIHNIEYIENWFKEYFKKHGGTISTANRKYLNIYMIHKRNVPKNLIMDIKIGLLNREILLDHLKRKTKWKIYL